MSQEINEMKCQKRTLSPQLVVHGLLHSYQYISSGEEFYRVWEITWCHSEINICCLMLMAHQVFEVQLGPLPPKTYVRISVKKLYVFLNLNWKLSLCSRRMLYNFKAISFNSPAMLQKLKIHVMAALILKMYVSVQMT